MSNDTTNAKSSRPSGKNITISTDAYERLSQDAGTGIDLKYQIEFYQRGWAMLTDQQKYAAITGKAIAPQPTLEPPVNPQIAAVDAAAETSEFAREMITAAADGKYTADEQASLQASAQRANSKLAQAVAAAR
jgi:hypothetical protein